MLQKCTALIGAAGLVLAVACAQTDAGISTNVKAKLAADDTVKAYQVNVDTRNGVVTLSGDVDSMAAKGKAVEIARATEGVRDVVDQIQVTAATRGERDDDFDIDDTVRREGREAADAVREGARDVGDRLGKASDRAGAAMSDATITAAVKGKLLADDMVKGLKIDVDTDGAVVTLNGTVSTRAEADRMVMLARNTEGVARVIDKLRVGN